MYDIDSADHYGLSPLFMRMERNYLRRCQKELRDYFEAVNQPQENIRLDFPRRKYNYCTDKMTPIFLCAILAGNESFEKRQLQEHCNIRGIEDVFLKSWRPCFQQIIKFM